MYNCFNIKSKRIYLIKNEGFGYLRFVTGYELYRFDFIDYDMDICNKEIITELVKKEYTVQELYNILIKAKPCTNYEFALLLGKYISNNYFKKVIRVYINDVVYEYDSITNVPLEIDGVIKTAEKYFGSTVNEKGYKVLNYVRVIQGDGINRKSINAIMVMLIKHGYSIDNISFGMGSALLAHPQRDDLMFALKSSWIEFDDGTNREFRKEPKSGKSKASKSGRLAVIREDGVIKTIREDELCDRENLLRPVFMDGKLLIDEDFDTIKKRVG